MSGTIESTGAAAGTAAPDVVAALAAWWERAAATGTLPVEEQAAAVFPFGLVHARVLDRGRDGLGAGCVALLDQVAAALDRQLAARPAATGSWLWFLGQWLPMLVDHGRGDCSHGTYVGSSVLGGMAGPRSYGPEITLTLLLADLLLAESLHAVQDGPGARMSPVAHLRARRVSTLATALVQNRGELLDRRDVAPLWPVTRCSPGGPPDAVAEAEAAHRLAARLLAMAPGKAHRFAELTGLPVTDLADEVTYLRVLQLFDVVFRRVGEELAQAGEALATGQVSAATAHMDAARVAMGRAIPFFRIVATMPKEEYRVVVQHTAGASAVGSGAYLRVVSVAAEADTRLGPADGALADAARGLARYWAQWHRTNWAVATRLAGEPAPGGPEAAPLFPTLAG